MSCISLNCMLSTLQRKALVMTQHDIQDQVLNEIDSGLLRVRVDGGYEESFYRSIALAKYSSEGEWMNVRERVT